MRKTTLMLATATAIFLLPAAPAHADKGGGHSEGGGMTGAIKDIIDDVIDVFTGDDGDGVDSDAPGAQGRENALEHIDENIEKHGGEHKGLENARENVAKSGDGDNGHDDDSLVEEIVEDVGEGLKDEVDEAAGVEEHPSGRREYHGRPNGNGNGKGPKK